MSSEISLNDVILDRFCLTIEKVMETEEMMITYWKSKFPIEFNRTDHARQFIWTIFSDIHYDVKKERPTSYDGVVLAKRLHTILDYNLASQCILNLQQPPQFMFDLDRLRKEILDISEKVVAAGGPDPKVKGKLMKDETPWTSLYNTAVNLVAIEKIASQFSNNVSWRLSARNQTPAMADSQNMSMLRQEAEVYMKLHQPHHKIKVVTWPSEFSVPMEFNNDGSISVSGFSNFVSKSGGDILGRSLFSRKLATFMYSQPEVINVFPRLNSVTVIANDSLPDDLDDQIHRIISETLDVSKLMEN